jgi:hypothetical protein
MISAIFFYILVDLLLEQTYSSGVEHNLKLWYCTMSVAAPWLERDSALSLHWDCVHHSILWVQIKNYNWHIVPTLRTW